MARPQAIIDAEKVADLAYNGSSNREIAAILGVDDKTIANRFSAILKKKRAERKSDLRKAQFLTAKEGNPALLIWLGKNELDQTDKPASSEDPPDDAATDGDGNKIDP